uniref:Uncharacterized protein n=1 Tax=Sander lucioperca TaxID=283035 RepID=A0A8C9XSU6_SANLU
MRTSALIHLLDLFNTLEDLKEEEFKKFKWCLQQRDILEGYQRIKESKLENVERQDTVDVMVKTYQLQGALKVTKKVLEEINRNDLVQSLPDTSSGPQGQSPFLICIFRKSGWTCETQNQLRLLAPQNSLCIFQHGVTIHAIRVHNCFPCDVCTGTKLKALKSCLVCLVSYCETHLEPHLTMSGLKRHQLIDPVENLEGRMCTKHDKPLELFCKTDQTCVCMLCSVLDHKMHDVVPLKEGYEKKKAELGKTEAGIQQMIQKRRLKIQEIKHSVDLSEEDADREIAEGVQVFTSLMESVERAVVQLEETLSKEMKKLLEAELKRVQQYAVDVTLDPDTAHPDLILSDDGKQVNHGDVRKNLPDNPERFSKCVCVLGKQSFSSGRYYFEVQVKGKTDWNLGVARESINRKGDIVLSPEDGYWLIWLRNKNEYKALAGPGVRLSLKSPPQKVGVFVDYEEGLVSFYDVDAAALIYSFTGCYFTEKLFPFFCPCRNVGGKNSAPLIISPVRVN